MDKLFSFLLDLNYLPIVVLGLAIIGFIAKIKDKITIHKKD
jgi:hypothetical protein